MKIFPVDGHGSEGGRFHHARFVQNRFNGIFRNPVVPMQARTPRLTVESWTRLAATYEFALGPLEFALKLNPALYSQIIRDKRVSHGAFRLWHLLRDMHGKNLECWPGLKHICSEIGCGKTALLGWIKELCAAGYLTVKPGSRVQSNRYVVVGGSIQNHGVVLSRTTGGPTSIPRGGPKRCLELNSLEPNSKNQGGPRLFPNEIKERIRQLEEFINNDRNEANTCGTKPARIEELKLKLARDYALINKLKHELAYAGSAR